MPLSPPPAAPRPWRWWPVCCSSWEFLLLRILGSGSWQLEGLLGRRCQSACPVGDFALKQPGRQLGLQINRQGRQCVSSGGGVLYVFCTHAPGVPSSQGTENCCSEQQPKRSRIARRVRPGELWTAADLIDELGPSGGNCKPVLCRLSKLRSGPSHCSRHLLCHPRRPTPPRPQARLRTLGTRSSQAMGCSCGQCIAGILSPRMMLRLERTAASSSEMVLDSMNFKGAPPAGVAAAEVLPRTQRPAVGPSIQGSLACSPLPPLGGRRLGDCHPTHHPPRE